MIENKFYSDFDSESMDERKSSDYRNPFQQDRDRIIHSSAFRRLQAKTQVFLSGEYDFYRTRLTHSIEVAQIGRSICDYLAKRSDLLASDFFIDPALVEAVCLTHDLGHPPFGHAGERILNLMMKDYGGFEGNAQTLRMITEIIYSDENGRRGMGPTRAFMDGTLKYKSLFSQLKNPENHFLYDPQEKYVTFVFGGKKIPSEYTPGKALNKFRSIECQIMDWADDTAYSINDIVDGIHAGFINLLRLEKWGEDNQFDASETVWLNEILASIRRGDVERTFARKIGTFIKACQLKERQNFMSKISNRYRYELIRDPEIQKEAEFYQRLSTELVFKSPELHQLEYKGNFILEKLFRAFMENLDKIGKDQLNLLPRQMEKLVAREQTLAGRARIICDNIAGMTDGFALRTYKRLFDPDFGSILDLV